MKKRKKRNTTAEYFDSYLAEYEQELAEDERIAAEGSDMTLSACDEMDPEAREKAINKSYELQKDGKFAVVPSHFAEATYLLDGRPFRLKDRNYYRFIHDTDIPEGLMKCSRQVEKSTTFSVKIANETLLNPFHRSLYYAPLNEQVKMFSEDRLGRLFTYSQEDIIKRTFISTHDKQNVFNKSFSNGSLIYLRHCFGTGDNIRGLSVNSTFGDEIQDIDIDAVPVIRETQAHAYDLGPCIRASWYAGTPKTFSNTIQELWNRSTQCEWVVRCPHCNREQILTEKNITEDKYLCANSKCRRELTARMISENGFWLKFKEDVSFWGFHITQMMSPSMPPKDVYYKIMTYDKQRLYNEVFGLSYENAEKPFPAMLLNTISDNNLHMLSQPEGTFNNVPIYMGIDWGTGEKSYTVVYIGAYNTDGKWQLLYTKRYAKGEETERDYQVADILRLMSLFRVAYCIADYGHGFQANQQLKNRLGRRFDCMYYSSGLGTLRTYDQKGRKWVVNRTRTMYEYVKAHQEYQVVWPGASRDDFSFLFDHHIAEQTEYRSSRPRVGQNVMITRSEEMYYSHPSSAPDDGVHAGVYAFTASLIAPKGVVGSDMSFAGTYSR